MLHNLFINEAIFVILDLETTGFNPENSSIIEIAGIKYQGGIVVDKFHSLVRPDEGFIPDNISKLTGITNALVIDQPKIDKVFPSFKKFIEGTIIVAHNAKFDFSFLNYLNQKFFGNNLKNPIICTDSLARRIFPEIKDKSLLGLAYHFNIPLKKQHRAMTDAEITLKVFEKMLEYLQDYNINKVIDIIKLSEGKKINHKNKRRRYV